MADEEFWTLEVCGLDSPVRSPPRNKSNNANRVWWDRCIAELIVCRVHNSSPNHVPTDASLWNGLVK